MRTAAHPTVRSTGQAYSIQTVELTPCEYKAINLVCSMSDVPFTPEDILDNYNALWLVTDELRGCLSRLGGVDGLRCLSGIKRPGIRSLGVFQRRAHYDAGHAVKQCYNLRALLIQLKCLLEKKHAIDEATYKHKDDVWLIYPWLYCGTDFLDVYPRLGITDFLVRLISRFHTVASLVDDDIFFRALACYAIDYKMFLSRFGLLRCHSREVKLQFEIALARRVADPRVIDFYNKAFCFFTSYKKVDFDTLHRTLFGDVVHFVCILSKHEARLLPVLRDHCKYVVRKKLSAAYRFCSAGLEGLLELCEKYPTKDAFLQQEILLGLTNEDFDYRGRSLGIRFLEIEGARQFIQDSLQGSYGRTASGRAVKLLSLWLTNGAVSYSDLRTWPNIEGSLSDAKARINEAITMLHLTGRGSLRLHYRRATLFWGKDEEAYCFDSWGGRLSDFKEAMEKLAEIQYALDRGSALKFFLG